LSNKGGWEVLNIRPDPANLFSPIPIPLPNNDASQFLFFFSAHLAIRIKIAGYGNLFCHYRQLRAVGFFNSWILFGLALGTIQAKRRMETASTGESMKRENRVKWLEKMISLRSVIEWKRLFSWV